LIVHPDLRHLARVRAVIEWCDRLFSEPPVRSPPEAVAGRFKLTPAEVRVLFWSPIASGWRAGSSPISPAA